MVRAGVSYALGRGFDSLLRHWNSSEKAVVPAKVDQKVDQAEDDVSRLTGAIARASEAGQWSIVELLGRQLEALTRTRAGNVVDLGNARARSHKR